MTAFPKASLATTFARVAAVAEALSLEEQQQLNAATADFFAPVLEGRPLAIRAAFWATQHAGAKHLPTLMQEEERKGVGFHEAAHVVVAWDRGIPFQCVTAVPNLAARGSVTLASPSPVAHVTGPAGRIEVESFAVLELAGIEGQRMAGHPAEPFVVKRHEKDAERHLMRYVPALPVASWLEFCRDQTRALLRAHWSDVERIAAALRDTDTLTAADVGALLEDARK